jgi:RNA polymerase sigma-70 factor (ECF subfamily)
VEIDERCLLVSSSDANLIGEILAVDAEGYAVLVKRYQKPIFNLMIRMTSSEEDAMDLTQETFVKAYEKLEQFKPSSPFFPWLYTIGLNLARDFLRKVRVSRTAVEVLSRDPDLPSDPGETAHDSVGPDTDQVSRTLQKLPEDYREALILRFHEGLSMNELSSALGISVSGAKMRIHRGLLRLRELLGSKTNGQ